jgi:hypothetical protein
MDDHSNRPGLETRAAANARRIEGWNVEKQARYELFMEAEKAGEQAAVDQHKAEREASDMALDGPPEGEPVPPDPWAETLAKIETMPSVSGALVRTKSHVNVTTAHLMQILGIRNSRDKSYQENLSRLAIVMESLGWEKPSNIWLPAVGAAKGYRKERYD